MAERMHYSRPEIHEVLLETSQAVLHPCKSNATSAKDGNQETGFCKKKCKQVTKSKGTNSAATS